MLGTKEVYLHLKLDAVVATHSYSEIWITSYLTNQVIHSITNTFGFVKCYFSFLVSKNLGGESCHVCIINTKAF